MNKILILIGLPLLLSGCGTLGWLAGHAIIPKAPSRLHVVAHLGDNSAQKNNHGKIAAHDISTINSTGKIIITHIPWSVIWVLMIGWPLALLGWMLDPPLALSRRLFRKNIQE